ncbi:MAG: methyltransferase domain-containing protein [Candidatus Magnetomorum sp.]|nr:methyltransferase domain-containing protein [Candidatus Magnetomorum sp.]
MKDDILDRARLLLTCPNCLEGPPGELNWESPFRDLLVCNVCRREYPIVDGIIDFVPDFSFSPGLAQKFMEHRSVVSVYEKYVRPTFTSLGSSITYEEEIAWLQEVPVAVSPKYALDLACGTGKYTRLLDEMYHPDIIFGADLSMPMLEKAYAQKKPNMIFIRCDASSLPFKPQVFSRVNCFGALHLFPDPRKALSELRRIMELSACFTCLTSRQMKGWNAWFQSAFSSLFSFHFFDDAHIEKILAESGYINVHVFERAMVLLFYGYAGV